MKRVFSEYVTYLLIIIILIQGGGPAFAGGPLQPLRWLVEPVDRMFHQKKPQTQKDNSIERLAMEIDWLEKHIDTWGTVVAKQPDIWGEARLTKHRDEYERMMFKELAGFTARLNARVSQTDQSYLVSATALTAAIDDAGASSTPPNLNLNFSDVSALLPDQPTIQRGDIPAQAKDRFKDFQNEGKIALEPTVHLDQLSRYLQHLHELRRIGEGDDTSDAPGYALNLVRIPVSILPGKRSRIGHGAEITITATPHLSDTLLATTFRNLVINDLVDSLALPITRLAETAPLLDALKQKQQVLMQELNFANARAQTSAGERDASLAGLCSLARKYNFELESGKELEQAKNLLMLARDPSLLITFEGHVDYERYAAFVEAITAKFAPTLAKQGSAFKTQQSWSNAITADRTQELYNKEKKALDDAQKLFDEAKRRTEAAEAAVQEANAEIQRISDDLKRVGDGQVISFTAGRSRRSRHPIAPSQVAEVFGKDLLEVVARRFNQLYVGRYVRWAGGGEKEETRVNLLDVRRFLQAEVEAAYEMLAEPDHIHAMVAAIEVDRTQSDLANAVRSRHDRLIESKRRAYITNVHAHDNNRTTARLDPLETKTTDALSWAVIVECAVLNQRLQHDMRTTATSKGCFLPPPEGMKFYLPETVMSQQSPFVGEYFAAAQAFKQYVECRWPIHVFALDPVTQDQNVADISSRRREMQLALALKFVGGRMTAGTLTRAARRLEKDVETISLNRTQAAFSHGNDTFGWRFMPRIQSLPAPGSLVAIGQSVFGGPSADSDLCHSKLEAGMRECVAVVLMPSFVPYCDFDIRSNWFKLTCPKSTELSMHSTMRLSRSIKAMQSSAAQCAQCAHLYRDGEVARMMRRVHQLDRELPLQSTRVQVPYENTLGGFEMFNTGLTDLAPELMGWYGAPGVKLGGSGCESSTPDCNCEDKESLAGTLNPEAIVNPVLPCPGSGTTLFLVGDNLSVHETKIIAGGVCIPDTRLISRQIMQVTIPSCVNTVKIEGHDYVDIHAATPYGVTSHLHVPAFKGAAKVNEAAEIKASVEEIKAKLEPFALSDPKTFRATFSYEESGNAKNLLLTKDENYKIKLKLPSQFNAAFKEPKRVNLAVAVGKDNKLLGPAKFVSQFQVNKSELIFKASEVLKAVNESLVASFNRYTESDPALIKRDLVIYASLQTSGETSTLPYSVAEVIPVELHLHKPLIQVMSLPAGVTVPPNTKVELIATPPPKDTQPTSPSVPAASSGAFRPLQKPVLGRLGMPVPATRASFNQPRRQNGRGE